MASIDEKIINSIITLKNNTNNQEKQKEDKAGANHGNVGRPDRQTPEYFCHQHDMHSPPGGVRLGPRIRRRAQAAAPRGPRTAGRILHPLVVKGVTAVGENAYRSRSAEGTDEAVRRCGCRAYPYFPPSAAVLLRSSEGLRTWDFGFLVRSGRAVLYPVYQGTYERRPAGAAGPNAARDLLIQRTKDVRRALDYLETRSDVDHQRLAFYGLSMGAYYGPLVAAVEERFRTLVLVSGGARGGLPEVTNINFAPRVRVPVLMLNGRHDFIFPLDETQRPLFRLLGTPEADKKHVLFDSGHVPPYADVVRETLDWLDRYLGPVTTGPSGP